MHEDDNLHASSGQLFLHFARTHETSTHSGDVRLANSLAAKLNERAIVRAYMRVRTLFSNRLAQTLLLPLLLLLCTRRRWATWSPPLLSLSLSPI